MKSFRFVCNIILFENCMVEIKKENENEKENGCQQGNILKI